MGHDQRGPVVFTIERCPNGCVTFRCGPISLHFEQHEFEAFYGTVMRVRAAIQAERSFVASDHARH